MKITVLTDNTPCATDSFLEAEHGLSIYIETGHLKILLDTGASDAFARNARRLGIDIGDVDYLVLSHAHRDHTGGLSSFLERNDKARIVLSAHINANGYYSTRRGCKRNISIDYDLLSSCSNRLLWVEDCLKLGDGIVVIGNIPTVYPVPKANSTLLAGDEPDNFCHEIALLVAEKDCKVLFSSCTHKGLLNTLSACPVCPDIFVGGLHLIDSDESNQYETGQEVADIAEFLTTKYPALQLYTGHCTGANAMNTLANLLGIRIKPFHTGFVLHCK